jgi:hypothetical protein
MIGRWECALVMLDSDDFSRWLVDAGRDDLRGPQFAVTLNMLV